MGGTGKGFQPGTMVFSLARGGQIGDTDRETQVANIINFPHSCVELRHSYVIPHPPWMTH